MLKNPWMDHLKKKIVLFVPITIYQKGCTLKIKVAKATYLDIAVVVSKMVPEKVLLLLARNKKIKSNTFWAQFLVRLLLTQQTYDQCDQIWAIF